MRRFMIPPLVLAAAMFIAWFAVYPVAGEEGEEEATFGFVGANKCKMCHKSEKSGAQFGIWSESAHAKAYETLAGEASLKIAKEKGIENPQTAPECLECHATAFAVMETLADEKISLEEGVSCEGCHGPGEGYWKKSTMEKLTAGEIEPASVGLTMPDEETCKSCHNEESPTFKGFDFDEYWAKIAHPVPEAAEGE